MVSLSLRFYCHCTVFHHRCQLTFLPIRRPCCIYARFSGKKRTSMYISREKGDRYYIQTRHNDPFCPLQSFFLGELNQKLARKARVNTERVYRILYRIELMPPWHPIILLKSNKFNMAAVSVKRPIDFLVSKKFKNVCRRTVK